MQQKIYDQEYENKLLEYFKEKLPSKIYDAHFHINKEYTLDSGYKGEPYTQFIEFTKKYTGRDIDGGLIMAQPSRNHSEETLRAENEYILKLAKKHSLAAGLIVRPVCEREQVENKIDLYPQIKALKPYLSYSIGADRFESDILEFAPEWMWELANDRKMPVVIHLSHYQNMLSDKNNIKDIKYITSKYPEAKLVLAHCAMGHHVQKLIWGLEEIKGIENIWFDCSGSAEPLSIYHCIKNFGVEKMMYGGDFNHAATVGRICSFGSNFIGYHPGTVSEENVPKDYKYQPLNNGQECLLALFQAIELMNLNSSDVEKIFYDNAVNLYG